MAGGIFKLSQPKVRPGVYVNVRNGKPPKNVNAMRGVAAIPLEGYDWGPREEWIKLSADSPDAARAKLGRSIYDDNKYMKMLQLLFAGATTVYVYITDGGEKAKKTVTMASGNIEITAKYKGSLGNTLKVVSVENPLGGFDVSVYLDGSEKEMFEGITKVDDIIGKSEYIDVTGSGDLEAFASVTLAGGTDVTEGNASITKFLDMTEKLRVNCICFPSADEALQKALATKVKYIRNSIGWKMQAVCPNLAGDYEGIINVINSFGDADEECDMAQAAAWLAGMTAGADYTTSLTYAVVEGATKVVGELSNEKTIEAIKKGQTYFSVDEAGAVILEYDINSKVTFVPDDPVDIMKNRPLRVYDTFCNDLLFTFRPGKFDVDTDGFKVMAGIGRALLQRYFDDGAIKNLDLDNDFIIDEGKSDEDRIYATVGIQPVDSADKYYFDVVSK